MWMPFGLHLLDCLPQFPVRGLGPAPALGYPAALSPSPRLDLGGMCPINVIRKRGRGKVPPDPTGDALGSGLDLTMGQRATLLASKRISALTSGTDSLSPCFIAIGPPILPHRAVAPFPHVIKHRDVTPQPARLFAATAVVGVASENGKNRTVSRWHGLASRKRSFLRGVCEKPTYASAGIETYFLEKHSRN